MGRSPNRLGGRFAAEKSDKAVSTIVLPADALWCASINVDKEMPTAE